MFGGRGKPPSPSTRDGRTLVVPGGGVRISSAKVSPNDLTIKHNSGSPNKVIRFGSPGRPYLTHARGRVDRAKLLGKFNKLERSPDHHQVVGKDTSMRLWTTDVTPVHLTRSGLGQGGIIITDISLNQLPDITIDSRNVPPVETTTPAYQPLSPGLLQRRISSVPYHSRHLLKELSVVAPTKPPHPPPLPTSRLVKDRSSNIQSVITRFISVFKIGSLCATKTKSRSPSPTLLNKAIPQCGPINSGTDPEGNWVMTKPSQVLNSSKKVLQPQRANQVEYRSSDHLYQRTGPVTRVDPNTTAKEKAANLRNARSMLDLQREREKEECPLSRYLEDLRVMHNINRREIITKRLYRESGHLFSRMGKISEPIIPKKALLLSTKGTTTPRPHLPKDTHTDPTMPQEDRVKILKKMLRLNPRILPPTDNELSPSWEATEFIASCLLAHNIYRARHSAPPLKLSTKLCIFAQHCVNELAHTETVTPGADAAVGENIYCRTITFVKKGSEQPDTTGEEVAAHWYNNVRHYNFSKQSEALQARAGSFSQMVWLKTKEFGVGQARSRNGKIYVVAHYSPAGNIGDFKENVRPLNTRAVAAELLCRVQTEASLPLPITLSNSSKPSVTAPLGPALPNPQTRGLGPPLTGPQSRPLGPSLPSPQVSHNPGDMSPTKLMDVLGTQPTRIVGRNATKILAAHMLGYATSIVPTAEEDWGVVIHFPRDNKRKNDVFVRSKTDGYTVQEVVKNKNDIKAKKTKFMSFRRTHSMFTRKSSSDPPSSKSRISQPDDIPKIVDRICEDDNLNRFSRDLGTSTNNIINVETPIIKSALKKPRRLKEQLIVSNENIAFKPFPQLDKLVNLTASEEALILNTLDFKKLRFKTLSDDTLVKDTKFHDSSLESILSNDTVEDGSYSENTTMINSHHIDNSDNSDNDSDTSDASESRYTLESNETVPSVNLSETDVSSSIVNNCYILSDEDSPYSTYRSTSNLHTITSTYSSGNDHELTNLSPTLSKYSLTSTLNSPIKFVKIKKCRLSQSTASGCIESGTSIESLNSLSVDFDNIESVNKIELNREIKDVNEKDNRIGLNLPFESHDSHSGLFTCYALSPLRY